MPSASFQGPSSLPSPQPGLSSEITAAEGSPNGPNFGGSLFLEPHENKQASIAMQMVRFTTLFPTATVHCLSRQSKRDLTNGVSMQIDHDKIMRRAAAISETLSAHARECDAVRKLTSESMATVVDAGLFRIPQPRRVGGYELSLRTLADAVTLLSEACPSSGWVLMVMGAHHWCLGSFPEAAQDDVFGNGRDGLVAGTLSSQGTANPVDGGFRVEGRWQFCSGVDHADWVILGCADPATHRPSVHALVPRADLEVDDTWHVMGLQGTGSKDVLAHHVFVPSDRTI